MSFGALLNMSLIGSGNGLLIGTAYESSLTVTNETSLWLLIPKGIQSVSVSINVLTNQARIEFTTVPVPLIDAPVEVTFLDKLCTPSKKVTASRALALPEPESKTTVGESAASKSSTLVLLSVTATRAIIHLSALVNPPESMVAAV